MCRGGDDNDSEADGRWRRRLAAPSGFRNEGAADSSQSGRAGNLLLADAIVCVCPRFGLGGALLLETEHGAEGGSSPIFKGAGL